MSLRHLLTAAVMSFAACASASATETLVLYTSQPSKDAQQTVDAFMAANPDIKVDWVRDGTTKIMAKLRAEFAAGAPKPDVLLIADLVTMEGLKREGRLAPVTTAPVQGYDKRLFDNDFHYFSTKLITTGIVYNSKSPVKPSSWQDLTKPELKGLVAMPSPLTSGAATIHMEAMTQNNTLGWSYYENLAANNVKPKGGNGGTFKAVASGEKMVGVVVDFLPIREKAKGSPVEFVFPSEGVSAVTEPVAVLETAKNKDAAAKFVHFLLSKEGQQLAADQGYLPAHPKVAGPQGFPTRNEIKLIDFDAGEALETAEADKKKFLEIFGE
ncbi:ABC transporter substrate-binding protein [Polycladidibacter stylochi]|uniref:ABC transporter substrate-binding protein n=1 Tax=Polycladidibacter stylochi TaxID=1807766 RepID=UPI000834415C|nr:ABC transporter substrate-binding protein [Pseudovibrio stylochi]